MKVVWWVANGVGFIVGIPLLVFVALVFVLHLLLSVVGRVSGLLMEHMTGATLDGFSELREKLQRMGGRR